VRALRPLAKKSTANQRKEHNAEKYIQWITTLSLTFVSFSCCCLPNPRNSLKILTYTVQGHLRSSILVSIESTYDTFYESLIVTLDYLPQFSRYWRIFSLKIAAFPHPTLVWRRLTKERLATSTKSIHHWKVNLVATILSMTVWVYLHSFSRCCLPKSRDHAKFRQNLTLRQFKVIHGHRSWCQSKARMRLPISH